MNAVRLLRADKVRVPFRRPFATAAGMWLAREAWLFRLIDGDGRIGVGEAVLEPADGETAATVLDHLVRDVAAASGRGLPEAEELELHGAPGRALRAALDAARFDLDGRPSRPLATGGTGVGVNATIASLGPAASAEAASQALEAGFTTIKLKAGAEHETEVLVARVRAVRAAVGPDVRLRLDVNGAWDLETATERLLAVARYGIEYVEQPLPGDDPAAFAELRRRVGIPLAVDEAVTSVRAARVLLEAEAVDVLVVKPARVGGPAVAAEIAALAAGRGVPVVVSTLFETGVGIAAALAAAAALPETAGSRLDRPPDHGLATAGLLRHDLLVEGLVVEDGRMHLPGGAAPEGPAFEGTTAERTAPERTAPGGLGIIVDEEAVGRFGVETIGALG